MMRSIPPPRPNPNSRPSPAPGEAVPQVPAWLAVGRVLLATETADYSAQSADVRSVGLALARVLMLHEAQPAGAGLSCRGCSTPSRRAPWPCPTWAAIHVGPASAAELTLAAGVHTTPAAIEPAPVEPGALEGIPRQGGTRGDAPRRTG